MPDDRGDLFVARLRTLDGPVDPPPDFADRLYADLTGTTTAPVRPLDPVEADAAGLPSPLGGGVVAARTGWGARNTPWLPFAVGLVAVALFAALIIMIRPAGEQPSTSPLSTTVAPEEAAPWLANTYLDPSGRFRVSYPDGWMLVAEELTPQGGVGPDVFALGTFEMVPGGSNLPTRALRDLGPGDAFIWVEERPGTTANAPRPASFAPLRDAREDSEVIESIPADERDDIGILQWIDFTDAGSDFYAIVAIGTDAPESLVVEAAAVLDSFAPYVVVPGGLQISDVAWDGTRFWMVAHRPVAAGDPPPDQGTVIVVDPDSGELRRDVGTLTGAPSLVAADEDAAWVAHWGTGSLSRLDPETGNVEREVELELPFDVGTGPDRRRFVPNAIAVEDSVVWVLTARGALAEVRDGGEEVVIHDLSAAEAQPEALAVIGRTAWVAAGQSVFRVGANDSDLAQVEVGHRASWLDDDGRLLYVGGDLPAGALVTAIDLGTSTRTGYVLEVPDHIRLIGTVQGMFGVVDVRGVLHTLDGNGAPYQTDIDPFSVPAQADAALWVIPPGGLGLRQVAVLGPESPPIPVAIPGDLSLEPRPVVDESAVPPGWEVVADPLVLPRTLEGRAVWTGQEVVVFDSLSRIGAYRPATSTWRELPAPPIQAGVSEVTMLWAGEELLVWSTEAGAGWDPFGNDWRVVDGWPFEPDIENRFVWAGSEVVDIDAGVAFDPETGQQRSVPAASSAEVGDEVVVTSGGAVYDVAARGWVLVPPSGLSPNGNDAVWTDSEIVAADYLMRAASYRPGGVSWLPMPDVPLAFAECPALLHLLGGQPLVEQCSRLALWDPAAAHWLPLAVPTPSSPGIVQVVSAGNELYAVGRSGMLRLSEEDRDEASRRLVVGGSMLDIPDGWELAGVEAHGAFGSITARLTQAGVECEVTSIRADAASIIRPYVVPGYEVVSLDFVVGGKRSMAVAVPHGGYDDRHHYVWPTSATEVIDVGCTDGRATPEIAANVWSPWQASG